MLGLCDYILLDTDFHRCSHQNHKQGHTQECKYMVLVYKDIPLCMLIRYYYSLHCTDWNMLFYLLHIQDHTQRCKYIDFHKDKPPYILLLHYYNLLDRD
jgi:hypothetical protein